MDEKQPPASRAQETLELVRELFAMGATEVEVNGVRVRFGARPVAAEPEPERTPEQIEAAEEADEKARAAAEEERTYWSA